MKIGNVRTTTEVWVGANCDGNRMCVVVESDSESVPTRVRVMDDGEVRWSDSAENVLRVAALVERLRREGRSYWSGMVCPDHGSRSGEYKCLLCDKEDAAKAEQERRLAEQPKQAGEPAVPF